MSGMTLKMATTKNNNGDDDEDKYGDGNKYKSKDGNKDYNDKDKDKEEVEDDGNNMVRTPSAAGCAAAVGRAPAPAKRISPKKPPDAAAPAVAAPANVDQLTADFACAGLDSLSFNFQARYPHIFVPTPPLTSG